VRVAERMESDPLETTVMRWLGVTPTGKPTMRRRRAPEERAAALPGGPDGPKVEPAA
jgi:hypothetical protein